MLLAIDIGNSTVSFGIFEGETLKTTFRAESRKKAAADENSSLVPANFQSQTPSRTR